MVRGAVPGSKGGWVMVRDAVKTPAQGCADAGFGEEGASGCRSAAEAEQTAEG